MERRKLIKLKNETREMNCNEVYEQFKNYIYKTAHGYENSGEILDDLVQIGNIGLVKAFNHYEIESGNMFMTFLGKVVNNQILMHLRKLKNIRTEISAEQYIAIDADGDCLTFMDILSDPINYEEFSIDKITRVEIMALIGKLSHKDKRVLDYCYFKEMTRKEVAEELNYSQSYISRIVKRSVRILKIGYKGA